MSSLASTAEPPVARSDHPTWLARDVIPLPDGRPAYSGYLGLLFFTFAVITYYLPGASVGAAVAAGSVAISLLLGRVRVRWGAAATSLVGVLGLAVLSLHDPMDPPWASQRTLELAKITLVFVASIHLLSTTRRVAGFATIWFGQFVLFPVRGALVNYLRGYDVDGRVVWNYVWDNSNDLAAGALVTAAVGGALLYVFRRGPARLCLLAGLVLISVVIVLSGSRGAFIGMAGATLMLVWHARRKIRTLVVAGCCVLVAVAAAPQTIRDRLWTLGRLSDPDAIRAYDAGSVKEREQIWKTAFAIIRDHPILGIGIGAFPKANEEYSRDVNGTVFGRAGLRRDAHSTYLTVWAELGTVGLLLYCGFLGASWHTVRSVRRRWRNVAPLQCGSLRVLEAGVIGYLLACLFGSFTVLTVPYLFLALSWSWATAVDGWGRAKVAPTPMTLSRDGVW